MRTKTAVRTIPFAQPIVGEEEKQAVLRVLASKTYVHGPETAAFAEEFAAYTGAPYAVTVASCTAGMHLSYLAAGIGAGDEVIVTAETHVATAHAVELVGAKPVFVDADPTTGNINVKKIEAALTPQTKGLALVHYNGLPANLNAIRRIADDHKLFVVEDCALALGARYNQTHVGLIGDVGCFSFYPVKHITTIEGGMVITHHQELAATIKRQSAFGVDRTPSERKIPGVYDVTHLGLNYRMNEVEAAIGRVQLTHANDWLMARRRHVNKLETAFAGIPGITQLITTDSNAETAAYAHIIILDNNHASSRLDIINKLNKRGVGTSVYYPEPVPLLTYYRQKYGYTPQQFPAATTISHQSIALPVGPHLSSADIDYLIESVRDVLE